MALTFTNQKLVLVGCILSIWSPLFLGLGVYELHTFRSSVALTKRQRQGLCRDAACSVVPQEFTWRERTEPQVEAPQILCEYRVSVSECPSWATWSQCQHDPDLPTHHRQRRNGSGVFCWDERGLYMWGTEPCGEEIWTCSYGHCSGYVKSERLCTQNLEKEIYRCYFDPEDESMEVQRTRYTYAVLPGMLGLVFGVLGLLAFGGLGWVAKQVCSRGMLGPEFCSTDVLCSAKARIVYLAICAVTLILCLETVFLCFLLPGQTSYSLWGAPRLPHRHTAVVDLGNATEPLVAPGFNQPSPGWRFVRIFFLVIQLYFGIILVVLAIYAATTRRLPGPLGYRRLRSGP